VESIALQRSFVRWWICVCVSGFFLFCLVSAIAGEASTFGTVVWSVLAAGALVLMIRIVRMGIFLSAERVTFRNYFCTYQFAWDEVDRFEAPPPYGLRRKDGVRARLRDGRLVTSTLYASGPMDRPGFADSVVQLLNDLHADPNRRTN
jgi:hypothetical protein